MTLQYENIVLRDMKETDIEDYVRWFTEETEWMNWDEPWDPVGTDEQAEKERWTKQYDSTKKLSENVFRRRFEIEHQGKHIGCVLSYPVDENYQWASESAAEAKYLAVGIDICEPGGQGKGLGTNALKAYMKYLADCGKKEIYIQTWSGNLRMIRMMKKLNFVLCRSVPNKWEIRGQSFSELVYRGILKKN